VAQLRACKAIYKGNARQKASAEEMIELEKRAEDDVLLARYVYYMC
jgi:hypothetical protein